VAMVVGGFGRQSCAPLMGVGGTPLVAWRSAINDRDFATPLCQA
jgi:hypothetical protein